MAGILFRRSPVDDPASKEYITSFYEKLELDLHPAWQEKATSIESFISAQSVATIPGPKRAPRYAIVTSGSVATTLDTFRVNMIETIGSGNRGAGCAEALLKAGYSVIFLYRQGSLRPFSRWLAKRVRKTEYILDHLQINETTGKLELQLAPAEVEKARKTFDCYQAHRSRLLELSFVDLQEYLYLLRIACRAIHPLGHRALLFLAAGLTKSYVPQHELRPPSSCPLDDKREPLKLVPVPHVLRIARTSWCPKAYIVAFRLQADPIALSDEAHKQLEQLGVHLVIGNVVASRDAHVLVVTEREEVRLIVDQKEELETSIVRSVSRHHHQFALEREALKASKSLLALSAKFCMYREDMSTLDEDAEGNKNVPFKKGIRIKSRRNVENSPIFELKSVYQNQHNSARCHVWQKVGPQPLEGASEIIVSFSPAGTPETVLNIFGDTWKGWLEDELKTLVDSAKKVPLSSYLKILAAPLTGDFGEAALLWDNFTKSLNTAWKERERTQFMSAMSNLMSLGFDRGLSPLEGLLPPQELLSTPPVLPPTDSIDESILPPSSPVRVHERKVSKPVFRGQSIEETDDEEAELLKKAAVVKVHNTIKRYAVDMIEQGVLNDVLDYVKKEPKTKIHITGYSLGGMMSQLFALLLGEALKREGLSTKGVRMIIFGSPRIGDEGFKARLQLLYPDETRIMNVIYPLDTIHAFPPASEGFVDACLKVFLRQPGHFTGRRRTSLSNYGNPLTWLRILDTKVDEMRTTTKKKSKTFTTSSIVTSPAATSTTATATTDGEGEAPSASSTPLCTFCQSETHTTERHRCSICTQRGSHRGEACPNKALGCKLCSMKDHAAGQHVCSVCKLRGHRGRDCHSMAEVGWAEMISYSLFHDYYYYSLAASQEDSDYLKTQIAEPSLPKSPASSSTELPTMDDTTPQLTSGYGGDGESKQTGSSSNSSLSQIRQQQEEAEEAKRTEAVETRLMEELHEMNRI